MMENQKDIQNDMSLLYPGFRMVSEEEKEGLLNEARDIAERTGFEYIEIIRGMSGLLQSFISPEDVLKLTGTLLSSAKSSETFPDLDEYFTPKPNREQRRKQQRESRKKGRK